MLQRLRDRLEKRRQWRRNLAASGPGHNPVHDPGSMRWRCSGCDLPWCCHTQENPCNPAPEEDQ